MTRTLVFMLLCLCLYHFATAQPDTNPFSETEQAFLKEMEDTLGVLSYAVIHDSVPEYRFGACRELITKLVKTLKTPNSFQYPFSRLQSVSIQYPQDSSFRIFTWQLYVNENEYRYYGAIQMNAPELELYPLLDRSFELKGKENTQLTPEEWYGVVYYNIVQTDGPEGRYYVLFGFDAYEFYRKRKVIDVLTFEKGQPRFGAPVFVEGGERKTNRIIREYSSEVSTRCNYDESLGLIIFDHFIVMDGPYGEGPVNYPDGSYEAYELKNGLWAHIEKVFNETQEEAPRPNPILDNRPKDILGREKN
ncbi:MAG TPA: hypothetical protein PKA00_01110 [Saprospiraceae bacterium]|nr:hypothetical protein [Saprospiraceae bacterium]HMQ81466.1 hypothetical protein [Saprospiraceae bacterium]